MTSGCPYLNQEKSGRKVETFGKSVVAEHAKFFACKDENTLTDKSMTDAHTAQNITSKVSVKVRAILNMFSDREKEPTVNNLVTTNNPASTGLWDKDGNFDEKRFQQLAKMAIKDGGKEIITRQMFEDLRKEIHGTNDYGNATHIFIFVPVSWNAVTDGSINELFEYYADHWYKNRSGKYEKALTVEQVRAFYTNPNAVMRRRIRGELPVPQPVEKKT
jgi:hypothetical protein